MTRKQINYLINVHEAQRDFAKDYLDKHYYELEANNQETEWIDRWLYHKKAIEELKNEVPDDE